MKVYRAVMEWRFYDDHEGDELTWRRTTSVWYTSRELVELALRELRDMRDGLILHWSEENRCAAPPEGDDAFFDRECMVEFKALRVEEIEVFDKYQLKDIRSKL